MVDPVPDAIPDPVAGQVKVDVWSDVACPWCYIGKRRFEIAVADLAREGAAVPVAVEFHSFELLPDTPAEFVGSTTDLLVRVKGVPEAQARQMHADVSSIAAEVGLEYDFGIQQPTNTLKAHQVLHLAKARGVQIEAKERLLRAHFVEGRHVGRDDDLADLGADVGLVRGEVLRCLQEGTYLDAVRADIRRARQLGIGGVPFFVIDGRYGMSGAQPPDVFARALTQARSGDG